MYLLRYKKFLLGCACSPNFDTVKDIVNSHLNNPFISTSSQTIDGWTVDCTNGHWNLEGTQDDATYIYSYDATCYDWTSGTGSISTTLYGGGRAILNFGNCWTGYAYVTVELGKDSQSITKIYDNSDYRNSPNHCLQQLFFFEFLD